MKQSASWRERKKNGECAACLKYSVSIFVEKIFKMQRLEVSCAVRHTYIYIYVVRRQRVNTTWCPLLKQICVKAYKYDIEMRLLTMSEIQELKFVLQMTVQFFETEIEFRMLKATWSEWSLPCTQMIDYWYTFLTSCRIH